jgi:DNA (cytosine-5)-methyltransferase 1
VNYYNEWDKPTAAWLAQLAADGHVPTGHVDTRSIAEVKGDDLEGFNQCHFFAGIGGWPIALQLAGWPCDRPVWTGSCPCQPFSVAGKRKGYDDDRHLWPVFRSLIEVRRPPVIFGEQVASADGREWLSDVRADLEQMGYEVGCADLCAASVGALHIRQRLYWVADAGGVRSQGIRNSQGESWSHEQFAGLLQAEARVAVPAGKDRALSDGLPSRVVQLRGYGNAIVPQVAAEFVRAYMEVRSG